MKKGDILKFSLQNWSDEWFSHYAIYAGGDAIIQYSGDPKIRFSPVQVREVSLKEYISQSRVIGRNWDIRVYKDRDNDWPTCGDGDEIVKRARSRIGECSFWLLFNNCEQFCCWARYNHHQSLQSRWCAAVFACICGAWIIKRSIAVFLIMVILLFYLMHQCTCIVRRQMELKRKRDSDKAKASDLGLERPIAANKS